jgi:hypothetical protein
VGCENLGVGVELVLRQRCGHDGAPQGEQGAQVKDEGGGDQARPEEERALLPKGGDPSFDAEVRETREAAHAREEGNQRKAYELVHREGG